MHAPFRAHTTTHRPRRVLATILTTALSLVAAAALQQGTAAALDGGGLSLSDAQARVALLAADGVSFVSTDWTTAPANAVLSEVTTRG